MDNNMAEKFLNTDEGQEIEIEVTQDQAFMLKLQEFDKMIADSEARSANLRAQKATFIFDTNVHLLKEAKDKKEEKKSEDSPTIN